MSFHLVAKKLEEMFPDAHCELFHNTPFQLLVSVVLSAQTTDKKVNECMTPLYKKGFTPKGVIKMGQPKFLSHIKSIGLAPTKSKNVIRLSQIILDEHRGEIPKTREGLEALPRVGRKTANVVLAEIFGEPTLAVDTHVFRVTARLGLHQESTPAKCEFALLDVIKTKYLPKVNHQFIFLGRRLCKARNPLCEECDLRRYCEFYKEK